MSVRVFKPSDFNEPTEPFIGSEMRKIEFEALAVYLLIQHIRKDQPFNEPIPSKYDHWEMRDRGWIIDHSDHENQKYAYTMSDRLIAILWAEYGKK